MTRDKALKLLTDARRNGIAWHEVASAVDAVEANPVSDGSIRTSITVCSELSGYLRSHLRRFPHENRFVYEYAAKSGSPDRAVILDMAFAALEIVSRIWVVNEGKAGDQLERLASGHVSSATLAADLRLLTAGGANSPSHVNKGRVAASMFRSLCLELVRGEIQAVDIGEFVDMRRVKHRWPKPDFVRLIAGEGCEGLDMVDLRAAQKSQLVKSHLLSETTKATFLDRLWIVYAGANGQFFKEQTRLLGGDNVGSVHVSDDLNFILEVSDPVGPPFPDRRALWLEDMRT
jgi:hypothetical protein